MLNVTFPCLRVMQVNKKEPRANEQNPGAYTTFNIDVEENTQDVRNGQVENKLIYHRLERVMSGPDPVCDIAPGWNIKAFVDVDGYTFQDQQTGEYVFRNRLKINGWCYLGS